MEKYKKSHREITNLRHQLQHGMKNLNYLRDHILYQIIKIILSSSLKSADNPKIRIYINEIENRITFMIKAGYHLELLTPETMKLLGSTKSKITKDENGESLPHLQITEVVLIYCNIVDNDYQQDWGTLYTFVLNKSSGQLLNISPKYFIFLKLFAQDFHIMKYCLLIKILNHLR